MGKKWNQDAKPSEKLLSMYTMLLFSGREASLSELSAELGCSKQVVLRLIDQLEASRFGKLLRAKRGRESAYRLERPKNLPKLSLNAEGIHQLTLCRDFMLHLLPDSMRKTVDAALQQASAYLPDGETPDAFVSIGKPLAKGRIDYSPFQEMLQPIIKGIRQNKVCAVQYKASIHGEAKSFEFAPKRLVAYREIIYIHGWIVSEKGTAEALEGKPRILALQRLQEVIVTRRSAAHIPDVVEEHQGVFGVMEGEPFSVQVKFSPSAATYVAERTWSEDQKVITHKDGFITLAMTARSPLEVISWILSFADAAELLTPKWLKEKLTRQVQVLAARYGKGDKTKSGVRLCIHRAADTIGGNCIEIVASTGERLLLDAGRPLDTPEGEPTPTPVTLDTTMSVSGVLLSHAHTDHCGLLETLPAEWPVYCGKATERLLHLSAAMGKKPFAQSCVHWENEKAMPIGPFTITPRLIDHSAFDAYALQIDLEGKTILYSGDFRAHGRKAKLTETLIQNPPKRVDALIMEGTNLPAANSELKPTLTEYELEEQFTSLFEKSQGRVFVSWSSTNIDRTVTLYRACKASGRVLVPDLYCMLVLMRLKEFGNIPQPEWRCGHMKAVVTTGIQRLMKGRLREPELIEYLIQYQAALSADKLIANPRKWVIMARGSLLEDYAKKGVVPNEQDTWVWSMWDGYLKKERSRPMREFFASCQQKYIHTSGHASPDVLKQFAEAMQPKILIPVHGEGWHAWAKYFLNIRAAMDGEWLDLTV